MQTIPKMLLVHTGRFCIVNLPTLVLSTTLVLHVRYIVVEFVLCTLKFSLQLYTLVLARKLLDIS